MANTPDKVHVVYVIGSAVNRVVKIGRSDDVVRRLAEIQRMSPVKLEVLWQMKASGDLETALHRRFKELRTHGEWFDFADDDPVVAVRQVAADEADRLARLAEPKARWDWWERTEVFLMNGTPWTMPPRSQGGWQCVAWDESRDRRCRQMMNADRSGDGVEWVVPGLGWLSGRSLDGRHLIPGDRLIVSEVIRRTLMQTCDSHHDSPESKREPTVWRPFDLKRDCELIRPFTPGPSEFGLLPGLEEMEARVRAFAETLVSNVANEASARDRASSCTQTRFPLDQPPQQSDTPAPAPQTLSPGERR